MVVDRHDGHGGPVAVLTKVSVTEVRDRPSHRPQSDGMEAATVVGRDALDRLNSDRLDSSPRTAAFFHFEGASMLEVNVGQRFPRDADR